MGLYFIRLEELHTYSSINQGLNIEIKLYRTTRQLESELKLELKIFTLS